MIDGLLCREPTRELGQARLELHHRLVAEHATRAAAVAGQGATVTDAILAGCLGGGVAAGDPRNSTGDLEERARVAAADVEHVAPGLVDLGGEPARSGDVVDVYEVASLAAI